MSFAPWQIRQQPFFYVLPPSQSLSKALIEKDPQLASHDFQVVYKRKCHLEHEEKLSNQLAVEILSHATSCPLQRKDLFDQISPEKLQRFLGFFSLQKYGLYSQIPGEGLSLAKHYCLLIELFQNMGLYPEVYLSGHELSSIFRGCRVYNPHSSPVFYCYITYSLEAANLSSEGICSLNHYAKEYFSDFSNQFFHLLNEKFLELYRLKGKELSKEYLSENFEQKYKGYFDNEGGVCVYKIGGVQIKVLLLPFISYFDVKGLSYAFFDLQNLTPSLEADKFAFYLNGFSLQNATFYPQYKPVSLAAHSPDSKKILDNGLLVDKSYSPFTFQDLLFQYSHGGVLTSEEDYSSHLKAYLSSLRLQEIESLDLEQDSFWVLYLNFIQSLYSLPHQKERAHHFLQSKPYFPRQNPLISAEDVKYEHQLVYLLCLSCGRKEGDKLCFRQYQLRPFLDFSLEEAMELVVKKHSLFLHIQQQFYQRFFKTPPCSFNTFIDKLCLYFHPPIPKMQRLKSLYRGLFNESYQVFQDTYYEENLSLQIFKWLLALSKEKSLSLQSFEACQIASQPQRWRDYLSSLSEEDTEIFDLCLLKDCLQDSSKEAEFFKLLSQHLAAFSHVLPLLNATKIFIYQKKYAPHLAFLMKDHSSELFQNSLLPLWFLPENIDMLKKWAKQLHHWDVAYQEFLKQVPRSFESIDFLRFYLLVKSPCPSMAEEPLKKISASCYASFNSEEKKAFHSTVCSYFQQQKKPSKDSYFLSFLNFIDLSSLDLLQYHVLFDLCFLKLSSEEQKEGINRLYQSMLHVSKNNADYQKALEDRLKEYPNENISQILYKRKYPALPSLVEKAEKKQSGKIEERQSSWMKSSSSSSNTEIETHSIPIDTLKHEIKKSKDKAKSFSYIQQLLLLNALSSEELNPQQSFLFMQELKGASEQNLLLFAKFLTLVKDKKLPPKCKHLIEDYFFKHANELLQITSLRQVLIKQEELQCLLTKPCPLASLEEPLLKEIEHYLQQKNYSEVSYLTPYWIHNLAPSKKGEDPLFFRYEAKALELLPHLSSTPCHELTRFFVNLYTHAMNNCKNYPGLVDHFPLMHEVFSKSNAHRPIIPFKTPGTVLTLLEKHPLHLDYFPYLFSQDFCGAQQTQRLAKIFIHYLSLDSLSYEQQKNALEKVLEHQSHLTEQDLTSFFHTFKKLPHRSAFEKLSSLQLAYKSFFSLLKSRKLQIAIDTFPDYLSLLSTCIDEKTLSDEQVREIGVFFSQSFSKVSLEHRLQLSPFLQEVLQQLWTEDKRELAILDLYKDFVYKNYMLGVHSDCTLFFLNQLHPALSKNEQFNALIKLRESLFFDKSEGMSLFSYLSLFPHFSPLELSDEQREEMLQAMSQVLSTIKILRKDHFLTYSQLLQSQALKSFYQTSLDMMQASSQRYIYEDFPEILKELHQRHPIGEEVQEALIAAQHLPDNIDKYLSLIKALSPFEKSMPSIQIRLLQLIDKQPEKTLRSYLSCHKDFLSCQSQEKKLCFFKPLFSAIYTFFLSSSEPSKIKSLAQAFSQYLNQELETDPVYIMNLVSLYPESSPKELMECFSRLLHLAKLSKEQPFNFFELLKTYFDISKGFQQEEKRLLFCLEFYQTFSGEWPLATQQACFDSFCSYLLKGEVPIQWENDLLRPVRIGESEKKAHQLLLELYNACFELARSLEDKRKTLLLNLLEQKAWDEMNISHRLMQASIEEKKALFDLSLRCQQFLLQDCGQHFSGYHKALGSSLIMLFRLIDSEQEKQVLFQSEEFHKLEKHFQKVFESFLKAPDKEAYQVLFSLLYYSCNSTQGMSSEQMAPQVLSFLNKMLKSVKGQVDNPDSLKRLCQIIALFHFAIEGDEIRGASFDSGRGLICCRSIEKSQTPILNDLLNYTDLNPKLFRNFLMDLFKTMRSYLYFNKLNHEQKQRLCFYNHSLFLSENLKNALRELIARGTRIFSSCDLMLLIHHLSMLPEITEADFTFAFVIRNQFYFPLMEEIVFQIDRSDCEIATPDVKKASQKKSKSPSKEPGLSEKDSKPYEQLLLEFAFSNLANKTKDSRIYVDLLISMCSQGFFYDTQLKVEPMLEFTNQHFLEITQKHCERLCCPQNRAFLLTFPSLHMALERCINASKPLEVDEYKSIGEGEHFSKQLPQEEALNDCDNLIRLMHNCGVLSFPLGKSFYTHEESLYHKYLKPRFHLLVSHLASLNFPEKSNFKPRYPQLHQRFEFYTELIKQNDTFNTLQPLLYYSCGLARSWQLEPLSPQQLPPDEDPLFAVYNWMVPQAANSLGYSSLADLSPEKLKVTCLYINAALNSPIHQYYDLNANLNFYTDMLRDLYSYSRTEYTYLFYLGFVAKIFIKQQKVQTPEISKIIEEELIDKFFRSFDTLRQKARSSNVSFPKSWDFEMRLIQCKALCEFLNLCFSYKFDKAPLFTKAFALKATQVLQSFLKENPESSVTKDFSLTMLLQMCEELQR